MCRKKDFLVAALLSSFIAGGPAVAQPATDPHRPPCKDARCKKIEAFLETHYCGESPAGEGPDDGCDVELPATPASGVKVTADFECDWNEVTHENECEQHGQPSSVVRDILARELRWLGLPAKEKGQSYFTVLESASSAWSLAGVYYSHSVGDDIELCQAVVAVDKGSHAHVLRKVSLQKTNAEVPTTTGWSPIDIADVDGDGEVEFILRGDAYEDHWLEVVRLKEGAPETIFSGLGYYL